MDIIPARWRPLVFGSLLVGAIILAFGYLGDDEGSGNDDGAIIGLLVVLLVLAVVTYLLWSKLVTPRLGDVTSAQTALVLGILSLPLGFLYWTGFVYAVAPAAIALGKETDTDSKGKAGMLTGALGLALGVIGGALDSIL
jgi:hypothetical protein